jgi:hypothetical protein
MVGEKRSKYGNKRCVVDGITFDSHLEAARWVALKDQEARGLIADLRR